MFGSRAPEVVGEIGDFKTKYGEKKPREGELCGFVQQNKGVIIAQEGVLYLHQVLS